MGGVSGRWARGKAVARTAKGDARNPAQGRLEACPGAPWVVSRLSGSTCTDASPLPSAWADFPAPNPPRDQPGWIACPWGRPAGFRGGAHCGSSRNCSPRQSIGSETGVEPRDEMLPERLSLRCPAGRAGPGGRFLLIVTAPGDEAHARPEPSYAVGNAPTRSARVASSHAAGAIIPCFCARADRNIQMEWICKTSGWVKSEESDQSQLCLASQFHGRLMQDRVC
jgi:hypothetical protein